MPLRAWALSLLFVGVLCAQTPPSSSARSAASLAKSPVDRVIDQLVENAASFRATLPSITARETIMTGSSTGWLSKHRVRAEATMRVVRRTPGGPLEESRQITSVNGKPLAPGQHANLPNTLSGGFGGLADFFFSATDRDCFDYVLVPRKHPGGALELHLAFKPDATSRPDCPTEWRAVEAVALISADTHQLMHLERTVPAEDAALHNRWVFASIDLAPVQIGDKTFWLPTKVTGRSDRGKREQCGFSHYSDYHRFTASINILPASP